MKKDPFAERESARYSQPIPSREYILIHCEAAGSPLSFKRLAKELLLESGEQRSALRKRLNAMVRENQLLADRRGTYRLPGYHDLVQGTVVVARDGTGRLVGDHADLRLSRREIRHLLPGDQVEAIVSGTDLRGRAQARVIRVTVPHETVFLGTFQREGRQGTVAPLDQPRQFRILGKQPGHDQVIQFRALRDDMGKLDGTARVIDVLGDQLTLDLITQVSLASDEIPTEFTRAAIRQAGKFGDQVDPKEVGNRIDLRDCHFVTIDGADAKDFDDAVYCEPNASGGWRLRVAIADVAHYVRPVSPLDKEAYQRGNSIYFPHRVVPMLPEALSNGLCSLNPDVDRFCLVCEMSISSKGRLTRFKFYEAVIRSHARLVYEDVARILNKLETKKDKKDLTPMEERLIQLQNVYQVLLKARIARGALDFDSRELGFELDENQHLKQIHVVTRTEAHRLIEECMLVANVAAARFLRLNNLNSLYRVHEGPDSEKLVDLRSFLSQFGIGLPGGDAPGPEDYQDAIESFRGRKNSRILQTVLLRSLSQAVYQPVNKGHFGLNYPEYAHFTSPIRRYPDLLLHRALKSVIHSKLKSVQVVRVKGSKADSVAAAYTYEVSDLDVLGDHCSMTERRAEQAAYDVIAWLKCQYMEKHVGDTFDGLITAVTRFGVFVEIGEFSIEGLIHISNLSQDYFLFDAGRQMLLGERTGKAFRLGDQVRVQVARVSTGDRKIDCELVWHQEITEEPRATSMKKRPRRGSVSSRRRSARGRRKSRR